MDQSDDFQTTIEQPYHESYCKEKVLKPMQTTYLSTSKASELYEK